MYRTTATLLALLISVHCAAEEANVAVAAKAFYPNAKWQERSVLRGDFSCQSKSEVAILGTSDEFIVVAIFISGLDSKPQILKYSAKVRVAKTAVLAKESLDLKPDELEDMPEGFKPSKTCSGLNLSDGEVDSAHIYWNTKYRVFTDWTL
jgi:hypothetical protein